jgi:hypothetical protein
MNKLRTLCAVAALALAPAAITLSYAQATDPAKPTMPSGGGAPTTPPTHPSEGGNPTTTPPPQGSAKPSGAATRKPTNTTDAAKQACKNMSAAQERADCMKKADAQKGSNTSDASAGKSKSSNY